MAKINLGDKFYSISRGGEVFTNIVGEVSLKTDKTGLVRLVGPVTHESDDVEYSLYGEKPHLHFSTPEEAVDAGIGLIKELLIDIDSKSKEEELEALLSSYENDRESVVQRLIQQNSFENKNMGFMNGMFRGKKPTFDADAIPLEYLYPGTRVWGVVTPATHFMRTPRIFPDMRYFILDTIVEKVTLVHHGAGFRYSTSGSESVNPGSCGNDLLCTSLYAAQAKMQDVFQSQTPGEITDVSRIPVLTKEDVAEAEGKRMENIFKSAKKLKI